MTLLTNWKLFAGIALFVILSVIGIKINNSAYDRGYNYVQAQWDKAKLEQSEAITQSVARQSESIASLTKSRAATETARIEVETDLMGTLENNADKITYSDDCNLDADSLQQLNDLISTGSIKSGR